MPTTQVRAAQPGYDPLASVSIMEQLRTATTEMRMPKRMPLIGHLPIVRQFQVLGALLVTFLVLAALMLFLDGRLNTQGSAADGDRDRNADALAAPRARHRARVAGPGHGVPRPQGQPRALQDRPRCAAKRRHRQGRVPRRVRRSESSRLLQDIKARWDRVDVNAGRVIDNQQSLTTLAKGLENINQGNNAMLELAQQAAQQIGQGGGSLREIEYANQLAVLSQRIAKNANALASSDEIDPEVAFLLGKDASTFRDILNGLLKGSDALRLAGVRNEDARATLTELQKRFTTYDQGVGAILQNMNRLVAAKQAARGVNNESDALLDETTKLAEQFESGGRTRGALWAAIVFVVLALVVPACCSARCSSTTRAFAPSKAKARTSATRRRFCGC